MKLPRISSCDKVFPAGFVRKESSSTPLLALSLLANAAVYKLGAVAHHLSCAVGHESDLNKAGEHYTAAFARPHNGADKLQWLICDDAICSSQETVVALRQAKENAYVVMYSKVS